SERQAAAGRFEAGAHARQRLRHPPPPPPPPAFLPRNSPPRPGGRHHPPLPRPPPQRFVAGNRRREPVGRQHTREEACRGARIAGVEDGLWGTESREPAALDRDGTGGGTIRG